jgi:hypothetical protein
MRATVFRALLLSVVLAGIVTFAPTAMFGYGVEYKTPIPPATFQAMTYEQQQQWRRENEIHLSGLDVLSKRLSDRQFWIEYAVSAVALAALLFVACILMSLWERSAMRSNLPLNTDARNERARAS